MQKSWDVLNDNLCFEHGCMNECHIRALTEEYENCISFFECIEESVSGNKTKCNSRNYVPGWNDKVKLVYDKNEASYKLWISCWKVKDSNLYEKMCSDRKIFKSQLKLCRKECEQQCFEALVKDQLI